jgi:tetratricopeptide (TPR) repeat protein
MKTCFLTAVLLVLFLTSNAFCQQAKLEGYVIDDRDTRVPSIRIVAPGGQAAVTDSKGKFSIAFPSSVQPGQATRIEIGKPNWVVYQPMFGYCVTQSTERNFEPLRVVIVPKGSPLALSPRRLSQVIAQWAAERVKLRAEAKHLKESSDEYSFLRQYAEEYGFTLEEFRDAAEQWAQIKVSDDKEERALKEYWRKNYGKAAQLATESAQVADEELRRANKKTIEASLKVIRRYKLAGNAYYALYQFKEALDAYNEINKRFQTSDLSKDKFVAGWAEIRFLLGNAKLELGRRVEGEEGPRLLKEALADYQQSATFYTRDQLPQDWAATQTNLGTALTSLGERVDGAESIKYLNDAVAAYRAALEIFTSEQSPQRWAATQTNLGVVLLRLGERVSGAESIKYLNDAVAAFRAALEILTSEQLPQQWAATQTNLGIVLFSLGMRVSGAESIKYLNDAVAAYRAAIEIFTRERLPQQWAATQTNLGAVLSGLGERVSGAESIKYLNDAVAAYRAALEVFTREQLPQQWAATQTNLGAVLSRLGERVGGAESIKYLNDAVAAFRAALEIFTREQLPQQWAATQTNLGAALSGLGERVSGAESIKYLNDAVAAHRAALEVRTRQLLPQQWAATQNNLGTALRRLGERVSGAESIKYLNDAVAAYRAALEVRTRELLPQQWAETQNNLAGAYSQLHDWSSGAEAYTNVLTLDPNNEGAYRGAVYLYHEKLFKFDKAFLLHQQWLTLHPHNISAQADFAEAHFSMGRFAECEQRINDLLAMPEVPVSTKTALRTIDIASLLADGKTSQVPVKLDTLIADVTRQPTEFKFTWGFDGTKHFIGQNESLSPYRGWLGQLFDALASKDRDTMLKALRDVRANFKEKT